jgi:hypothetical protein
VKESDLIGYVIVGVSDMARAEAFCGRYFRDLDGNKLCAFRMGPAG